MSDKIADKVKKLFALADNNPNEFEAERALRMARKLLDRNSLTMTDLAGANEQVGIAFTDEKMMPYVRTIYTSICKLYDCKYVIDKNYKPVKHLIIGSEANRITASIIITYVLQQVRHKSEGLGNAYRNAVAHGVLQNVNAIMAEREGYRTEVVPGMGLGPVDISKLNMEAIDQWTSENMNLRHSTHNRAAFDSSGITTGKGISLNSQLSSRKALN